MTTDAKPATPARPQRRGQGFAWKSGLLASSVGGVLLGWALLAQPSLPAPRGADSVPALQPPVVLAQTQEKAVEPDRTQPSAAQQTGPTAPQVTVRPRPQKPGFRRPTTRTRGS